MIKFKFPKKNEKAIYIIEQTYARVAAQRKSSENVEGVIGGLARALSRKQSVWVLAEYFLKYEPFWHITGESFFEYIRKAQYRIDVKPEVRSVKINKKVVNVDGNKPQCSIEGEEHCFEKSSSETLITAARSKDSEELRPYLKAKYSLAKSIASAMNDYTDIVPMETRASFLVSEMIKKLLKPVQADKIIEEKVEITKLALYLRPIHVFNYKDSVSGKMKTIEVDAVTGDVTKPSVLVQKLKGARPSEDMLFDIGGGIVDSVVPGAGIGTFIGKGILKYRRDKKIKQEMESSKAAFNMKK